jgi:phospholipid/cholesterol/gamma-HCH transport system substrate-binding protein
MRASPTRDLVVGLFVLAGLAAIGYLSVRVGGLSYKGPGGLSLVAHFDEIGGLTARAPVVISGVKVGQVSDIRLDSDLRAQVTLELDGRLELPVDTSAAIRTSGLLGDQYIALVPGAEEQALASGDVLSFTESALNIESLVGRMVHSFEQGEEK